MTAADALHYGSPDMANKRPDQIVASVGTKRKQRLEKRARKRDMSVSELLRRILDEHPETMPPALAQEAIGAAE